MKYRNAREIFPGYLLKQIQRYISGETIYIPVPDGSARRSWGETSGYQQFIRERNAEIKSEFAAGKSIEELAEKYWLSSDTLKRIVYSRKEQNMLSYSAALSSAKAYADAGKIDSWIHLYLNENGRNIPFSDGLKLFDRYYLSPMQMPLNLFKRCAGPEPEMKYQIDKDWFEFKVSELEKAIRNDPDMPPLIVHYVDGGFELNDGNHRHKAYEKLGIKTAWVIVWITEPHEYEEFMQIYGEYAKGCTVIRK